VNHQAAVAAAIAKVQVTMKTTVNQAAGLGPGQLEREVEAEKIETAEVEDTDIKIERFIMM
jgi:hypothetical protein